MRAVFNNNVSEVRTLIEAGAYVDAASTRYGTTVLMMAAMNGYNEVVLELLSSGALVNATNKSGYTALHLAAKNGHAEVVRLLLQGGADKTMRDSSGKTAVDYAQTPFLMQLLK